MKHVILGLCSYTHDSAAALMVDNEFVGAVEEERLSGIKHTKSFPSLAIDWLLESASLKPSDVTHVGYNYSPQLYTSTTEDLRFPNFIHRTEHVQDRLAGFEAVSQATRSRVAKISDFFPDSQVRSWRHHLTHARYAAEMIPDGKSAILVIDSLGERDATTVWESSSEGGKVRLGLRLGNPDPHSLGYVYASVTEYLGYRRGDEEGTVMALAAHGDATRFRELMTHAIWLTDGGVMVNPNYFQPRTLQPSAERLTARFRRETRDVATTDLASQVRADLAAALQERTEQAVLHLARIACSRVETDRLTIVGGVAMNCVAMGRVAEASEVKELRIPPAPGDAGTAIGAALLSAEAGIMPAAVNFALGPECSVDDFQAAAAKLKPYIASTSEATPKRIAALLARGDIVGVCRDRVEFGPRALGNRSILANPLVDSITAILNSRIKHREAFRPYAPAVPLEVAEDWFELNGDWPFMSVACMARPNTRRLVPEIVHENGRCRVQTVEKGMAPFFHSVLQEFYVLTGVPILINTSLNVKGKPMSGTASMAVDCFAASSLDALCLGGQLYERR